MSELAMEEMETLAGGRLGAGVSCEYVCGEGGRNIKTECPNASERNDCINCSFSAIHIALLILIHHPRKHCGKHQIYIL